MGTDESSDNSDREDTPPEHLPESLDPEQMKEALSRTGRMLSHAGLPFDDDEFDDDSASDSSDDDDSNTPNKAPDTDSTDDSQ